MPIDSEVWGILERLRSNGRSIILSTHYMEEAEQLADTIIMISKGTIIANDTSERLKASFSETGISLEDVYARLVGEAQKS